MTRCWRTELVSRIRSDAGRLLDSLHGSVVECVWDFDLELVAAHLVFVAKRKTDSEAELCVCGDPKWGNT